MRQFVKSLADQRVNVSYLTLEQCLAGLTQTVRKPRGRKLKQIYK